MGRGRRWWWWWWVGGGDDLNVKGEGQSVKMLGASIHHTVEYSVVHSLLVITSSPGLDSTPAFQLIRGLSGIGGLCAKLTGTVYPLLVLVFRPNYSTESLPFMWWRPISLPGHVERATHSSFKLGSLTWQGLISSPK